MSARARGADRQAGFGSRRSPVWVDGLRTRAGATRQQSALGAREARGTPTRARPRPHRRCGRLHRRFAGQERGESIPTFIDEVLRADPVRVGDRGLFDLRAAAARCGRFVVHRSHVARRRAADGGAGRDARAGTEPGPRRATPQVGRRTGAARSRRGSCRTRLSPAPSCRCSPASASRRPGASAFRRISRRSSFARRAAAPRRTACSR